MAYIDVIIPSLRPFEIERRIREFQATCGDIDYQLIIVSPFSVRGPKVLHLQEATPNGPIAAINMGFGVSNAPYVCFWSDDASPTPNCLSRMVEFLEGQEGPTIGSFRYLDLYGSELPQHQVYNLHYACWGCASRKTLDSLGGLFDPSFRSFWADPDLACRAWSRGGSVQLCPDSYILLFGKKDAVSAANSQKHFDNDLKNFLARWHSSLGANKPLGNWREINTSMLPGQLLQSQSPIKFNTWHPRTFDKKIVAFVEKSVVGKAIDCLRSLKIEGIDSYLLCHSVEGLLGGELPEGVVGQEIVPMGLEDEMKVKLALKLNANWYLNLKFGDCLRSPLSELSISDFICFADALGFNCIKGQVPGSQGEVIAWKQPASNLFIKSGKIIHPAPDVFYLPLLIDNGGDEVQVCNRILGQTLIQMMIMIAGHQVDLGSKHFDTYAISHFVNTLLHLKPTLSSQDFDALSLALQSGTKEDADRFSEDQRCAIGLVLKSFARFSNNSELEIKVDSVISNVALKGSTALAAKLIRYS